MLNWASWSSKSISLSLPVNFLLWHLHSMILIPSRTDVPAVLLFSSSCCLSTAAVACDRSSIADFSSPIFFSFFFSVSLFGFSTHLLILFFFGGVFAPIGVGSCSSSSAFSSLLSSSSNSSSPFCLAFPCSFSLSGFFPY